MNKTIQMAAKLYLMRDQAKAALGDRYAERMAEGGRLLSAIAEKRGCGVLEVAINVSKAAMRKGDDTAVVFILAAAVELLEPSEAA